MIKHIVWLIMCALYLAGCASKVVPPELQYKVNRTLSFETLIQDPNRYQGEWIVLGGIILSSNNLEKGTELEILQKPLTRTDEPRYVDGSGGRFIARYPGYLETNVYAKNRRVSIIGEVSGVVNRLIGEMPYSYLLIHIQKIHLWPEMDESDYYPYYPYGPYWYGPYYYPWRYRYPYPYRYPYGYPYRYPYRYPYYPYWP
jgi:outer membrane lipoprotein